MFSELRPLTRLANDNGANLVGVRGLDTMKGLNSATNLDKATRDF